MPEERKSNPLDVGLNTKQYKLLYNTALEFYGEAASDTRNLDVETTGNYMTKGQNLKSALNKISPSGFDNPNPDLSFPKMHSQAAINSPKDIERLHDLLRNSIRDIAAQSGENYDRHRAGVIKFISSPQFVSKLKREKAMPGSTAQTVIPRETSGESTLKTMIAGLGDMIGGLTGGVTEGIYSSPQQGALVEQQEQARLKAQSAYVPHMAQGPQQHGPEGARALNRLAGGTEFQQRGLGPQRNNFEQPLGMGEQALVAGTAAARGGAHVPSLLNEMTGGGGVQMPGTFPVPEGQTLAGAYADSAERLRGQGAMQSALHPMSSLWQGMQPLMGYAEQRLAPRGDIGMAGAETGIELEASLPAYGVIGKGLGMAGKIAGKHMPASVRAGASKLGGWLGGKVGEGTASRIPEWLKNAGAREKAAIQKHSELLGQAGRVGAGFHGLSTVAAGMQGAREGLIEGVAADDSRMDIASQSMGQGFEQAWHEAKDTGVQSPVTGLFSDAPTEFHNPITGGGFMGAAGFGALGKARSNRRLRGKTIKKAKKAEERLAELEARKSEYADKLSPEQRDNLQKQIDTFRKQENIPETAYEAIAQDLTGAEKKPFTAKEVRELNELPQQQAALQEQIKRLPVVQIRPRNEEATGFMFGKRRTQPTRVDLTKPSEDGKGIFLNEHEQAVFKRQQSGVQSKDVLTDAPKAESGRSIADDIKADLAEDGINIADQSVRQKLVDKIQAPDATDRERIQGMLALKYDAWENSELTALQTYVRKRGMPVEFAEGMPAPNDQVVRDLAFGKDVHEDTRAWAVEHITNMELAKRTSAKEKAVEDAKTTPYEKLKKEGKDLGVKIGRSSDEHKGKGRTLTDPYESLEAWDKANALLANWRNKKYKGKSAESQKKLQDKYEEMIQDARDTWIKKGKSEKGEADPTLKPKDEPPEDDGGGGTPPPKGGAPTTPTAPTYTTAAAPKGIQKAADPLDQLINRANLDMFVDGRRRGATAEVETAEQGEGASSEPNLAQAARRTERLQTQSRMASPHIVENLKQIAHMRREGVVKLGDKQSDLKKHHGPAETTTRNEFVQEVETRIALGSTEDLATLRGTLSEMQREYSLIRGEMEAQGSQRPIGGPLTEGSSKRESRGEVVTDLVRHRTTEELEELPTKEPNHKWSEAKGERRLKAKAEGENLAGREMVDMRKHEKATGPSLEPPTVENILATRTIDLDALAPVKSDMNVKKLLRHVAGKRMRAATSASTRRPSDPVLAEKVLMSELPGMAKRLRRLKRAKGAAALADRIDKAYQAASQKALKQANEPIDVPGDPEATPGSLAVERRKYPQGFFKSASSELLATELRSRIDYIDARLTKSQFDLKEVKMTTPYDYRGNLHHSRLQMMLPGAEVKYESAEGEQKVRLSDSIEYNAKDGVFTDLEKGYDNIPIENIKLRHVRRDLGLEDLKIQNLLNKVKEKDWAGLREQMSRMSTKQVAAWVNYVWPRATKDPKVFDDWRIKLRGNLSRAEFFADSKGNLKHDNAMAVAHWLLQDRAMGVRRFPKLAPAYDAKQRPVDNYESREAPGKGIDGMVATQPAERFKPAKNITDSTKLVEVMMGLYRKLLRAAKNSESALGANAESRKIAQKVVEQLAEYTPETLERMTKRVSPKRQKKGAAMGPMDHWASEVFKLGKLPRRAFASSEAQATALAAVPDLIKHVREWREIGEWKDLPIAVNPLRGVERQAKLEKPTLDVEESEIGEREVRERAGELSTEASAEEVSSAQAVEDAWKYSREREPGGDVDYNRAAPAAARLLQMAAEDPKFLTRDKEGTVSDPDLLGLISILRDNPAPSVNDRAPSWTPELKERAGDLIARLTERAKPFGEDLKGLGPRKVDMSWLDSVLLKGRRTMSSATEGLELGNVSEVQEPTGGRERHDAAKKRQDEQYYKSRLKGEIGLLSAKLQSVDGPTEVQATAAKQIAANALQVHSNLKALSEEWLPMSVKFKTKHQRTRKMKKVMRKVKGEDTLVERPFIDKKARQNVEQAYTAALTNYVQRKKILEATLAAWMRAGYTAIKTPVPPRWDKKVQAESVEVPREFEDAIAGGLNTELPTAPKVLPKSGKHTFAVNEAEIGTFDADPHPTNPGEIVTRDFPPNIALVTLNKRNAETGEYEVRQIDLDTNLPTWRDHVNEGLPFPEIRHIRIHAEYLTGTTDMDGNQLTPAGKYSEIAERLAPWDDVRKADRGDDTEYMEQTADYEPDNKPADDGE